MKYKISKNGIIITVIETMNARAITTKNILMDSSLENTRKRVGQFILNKIKEMKPNKQMVSWNTSIGTFCIYKESKLDYCFEPHKSKYDTIKTILEFAPIKGDVKKTTIKSHKIINKDFEGFDECPNCFKKELLEYKIIRQDGELIVCKECYDFDKILDKLYKKQKLTKSEIRSLQR